VHTLDDVILLKDTVLEGYLQSLLISLHGFYYLSSTSQGLGFSKFFS